MPRLESAPPITQSLLLKAIISCDQRLGNSAFRVASVHDMPSFEDHTSFVFSWLLFRPPEIHNDPLNSASAVLKRAGNSPLDVASVHCNPLSDFHTSFSRPNAPLPPT